MSETTTSPIAAPVRSEQEGIMSPPIFRGVALSRAVLPAFQSHKVVGASKIKQIILDGPKHGPDATGKFLVIALASGADFVAECSEEWLAKHAPNVGGYLVVYQDGYVSYSPASAFENGYSPYGGAVTEAPDESRVCRQCLGSGSVNTAGPGYTTTKPCPSCQPELNL
jgi:hypothetical protein